MCCAHAVFVLCDRFVCFTLVMNDFLTLNLFGGILLLNGFV